MALAILWSHQMLDILYKKLHIVFISAIMFIITLIIVIVAINNIELEQLNRSTFFQRMSMLLIYQIEDNESNLPSIIQTFEDKYEIFCSLKDDKGTTLYQSSKLSSIDYELLLHALNEQYKTQESAAFIEQSTTIQGGIFQIMGNEKAQYWAIPARIVSRNEQIYEMSLFYKQVSTFELLQNQLPFYLVIWLISFLSVLGISHILLKKAFAPTKLVLKSQKEFVASASHELKSPLAVILANVESIKQSHKNEPQIQKAIKSVDAECMRMANLVKDMLLLASSDAKTWTLHKQDVNMDTLLITLYETFEPICRKASITLEIDIENHHYPMLFTDEDRVLQILSIFIDNAIQHAKNASTIQIQTSLSSKYITIYIIDHGQGIAEEDKPFIFQRFYCADKSRNNKAHFGLGLSIAEELAHMLQGSIGLKDTPDGGATFYVSLPLK